MLGFSGLNSVSNFRSLEPPKSTFLLAFHFFIDFGAGFKKILQGIFFGKTLFFAFFLLFFAPEGKNLQGIFFGKTVFS